MKDFDTTKGKAPYGVWIHIPTGERKFYDENGMFYSNTKEIEKFAEQLSMDEAKMGEVATIK